MCNSPRWPQRPARPCLSSGIAVQTHTRVPRNRLQAVDILNGYSKQATNSQSGAGWELVEREIHSWHTNRRNELVPTRVSSGNAPDEATDPIVKTRSQSRSRVLLLLL